MCICVTIRAVSDGRTKLRNGRLSDAFCAVDSTEYRHAATEMGLNEDEADDANHDVTPVERRSRRGMVTHSLFV